MTSILTLLLLLALSIFGQSANFDLSEYEETVKLEMASQGIPGLSIGVFNDGKTWAKGFGYADFENKTLAKAESMYRLASVTKPMTAMAILKLVDEGKIELDAEVQKYVPYFPKKKHPVTVRQVLGHIGGISHYRNYGEEGFFKDRKNTKQSLAVFQDWDLIAEPGTRYRYSSYGYNLLGAVIEGASGESYANYMKRNIWGPMSMKTIVMDDPQKLIPNRVRGYAIRDGKLRNSVFVDISSRFAAGGTRASVLDMLRLGRGILERKVLSDNSFKTMTTSMALNNGRRTFYGAGINNYPQNGRFVLQHSGAQQETSTHLFIFPSRQIVIAIASNLEGTDRVKFAAPLFEAVTGEAWNTSTYLKGQTEKWPLLAAMQSAFELGRGYYEKVGREPEFSSKDIEDAFSELNREFNGSKLTSDNRGRLLNEASSHRFNKDSILEKVGYEMAKSLNEKHGAKKLADYSNTGAIGFFNDYAALTVDQKYTLHPSIKVILEGWERDWSKTNSAESRSIVISESVDIEALDATIRSTFSGSVYPNVSGELVALMEPMARKGKFAEALQVGKLASDVYPDFAFTNSAYGSFLAFAGNRSEGIKYLKKAVAINPNGLASSAGLRNRAVEVTGAGFADLAINLMQAGIEMYPKDARMHHVLGVIYSFKKDNAKAIASFQKALSIDPNFENAAQAKSEIERLKQ